jgi:hypothetical protein
MITKYCTCEKGYLCGYKNERECGYSFYCDYQVPKDSRAFYNISGKSNSDFTFSETKITEKEEKK